MEGEYAVHLGHPVNRRSKEVNGSGTWAHPSRPRSRLMATSTRRPRRCYAGLDLSRQRLDVHVLDEDGRTIEVTAVRPDVDALRTLAAHVLRQGQEVSATGGDTLTSDAA